MAATAASYVTLDKKGMIAEESLSMPRRGEIGKKAKESRSKEKKLPVRT